MNTEENTLGNNFYDLVIIGSGPAGIHAAVQASKLGKKVCIIEKLPGRIGGGWIHSGTLPSKTLRESLATIHSIQSHVGNRWVDRIIEDLHTDKLFARARKVSMQEELLVRQHIENNKIDLKEGYGSLDDEHTVRVIPQAGESYTVKAKFILIATGSKPRRPAEIPFDGWRVVDSDDVLLLEHLPKSMVIYGAGVIGCEYACIFSAIGVQVTVVDQRSRILQYLDLEIGNELKKSMESIGVTFLLSHTLDKVIPSGAQVKSTFGETVLESDVFFFCAGRVSSTDRIGLERLGVKKDERGTISVDENFRTNIPNIYAAGDAIGPPALAATSSQQGRYVSCHAFGVSLGTFPINYPVGVYTIPELSMVGKTEEELQKEGVEYVVGRAHYNEIARGYIRGDAHGLLKLIINKKTHKIIGIHIVGADACNLIHIGLAFMVAGGHIQDMVNMIFNYPTLAEGYRIAAFNALNKLFPNGVFAAPPRLKTVKLKTEKSSQAEETETAVAPEPLPGVMKNSKKIIG